MTSHARGRSPGGGLLLVAAAIAAGLAGAAHAARTERVYQQNAASVCQGALPAFAGTLRARPLGIANEGAAVAYLTCSFTREGAINDPVNRLSLRFENPTAAPLTISCTGVFGARRGLVLYLPKTTTIAAGDFGNIAWSAGDNGGADLPGPGNTSCLLPTGAMMLETYNYFDVEIGS